MPIDDDIENILDLEEDEKIIHSLHRTYLSFAIPFIFGVIGIVLFVYVYLFGNLLEFILEFQNLLPFFVSVPFLIIVIVIVAGVIVGKWYAKGHLFIITTKRILFYTKFVTKNLRELRYKKAESAVGEDL